MRVEKLAGDLSLRRAVAKQLKSKLLRMDHQIYLWLYLAIKSIYSIHQNSFTPDEESINLLLNIGEDTHKKILNQIREARCRKSCKLLYAVNSHLQWQRWRSGSGSPTEDHHAGNVSAKSACTKLREAGASVSGVACSPSATTGGSILSTKRLKS